MGQHTSGQHFWQALFRSVLYGTLRTVPRNRNHSMRSQLPHRHSGIKSGIWAHFSGFTWIQMHDNFMPAQWFISTAYEQKSVGIYFDINFSVWAKFEPLILGCQASNDFPTNKNMLISSKYWWHAYHVTTNFQRAKSFCKIAYANNTFDRKIWSKIKRIPMILALSKCYMRCFDLS